MDAEAMEQAIAEYEALRPGGSDPGLEAVQAAIFLEDVLGVLVTDDDIRGDLAAQPPDLRSVVARARRTG